MSGKKFFSMRVVTMFRDQTTQWGQKWPKAASLSFDSSHTRDSVLQQCSTVNILLRAQTNKWITWGREKWCKWSFLQIQVQSLRTWQSLLQKLTLSSLLHIFKLLFMFNHSTSTHWGIKGSIKLFKVSEIRTLLDSGGDLNSLTRAKAVKLQA